MDPQKKYTRVYHLRLNNLSQLRYYRGTFWVSIKIEEDTGTTQDVLLVNRSSHNKTLSSLLLNILCSHKAREWAHYTPRKV